MKALSGRLVLFLFVVEGDQVMNLGVCTRLLLGEARRGVQEFSLYHFSQLPVNL